MAADQPVEMGLETVVGNALFTPYEMGDASREEAAVMVGKTGNCAG